MKYGKSISLEIQVVEAVVVITAFHALHSYKFVVLIYNVSCNTMLTNAVIASHV